MLIHWDSVLIHIALFLCVCVRERVSWNISCNLDISVCLGFVYGFRVRRDSCGKVCVVFTSSCTFEVRFVFSAYLYIFSEFLFFMLLFSISTLKTIWNILLWVLFADKQGYWVLGFSHSPWWPWYNSRESNQRLCALLQVVLGKSL